MPAATAPYAQLSLPAAALLSWWVTVGLLKVRRQVHEQRLHRVTDLLGRYPLPGTGQRNPCLSPHI
jgi:hypothetical protein